MKILADNMCYDTKSLNFYINKIKLTKFAAPIDNKEVILIIDLFQVNEFPCLWQGIFYI